MRAISRSSPPWYIRQPRANLGLSRRVRTTYEQRSRPTAHAAGKRPRADPAARGVDRLSHLCRDQPVRGQRCPRHRTPPLSVAVVGRRAPPRALGPGGIEAIVGGARHSGALRAVASRPGSTLTRHGAACIRRTPVAAVHTHDADLSQQARHARAPRDALARDEQQADVDGRPHLHAPKPPPGRPNRRRHTRGGARAAASHRHCSPRVLARLAGDQVAGADAPTDASAAECHVASQGSRRLSHRTDAATAPPALRA